ncbi:MAG TPA: hypothetical protein VMG09_06260 [Bacteroidota bacterium]|nr:hypothetical protein [Bacteroidota bacterium]
MRTEDLKEVFAKADETLRTLDALPQSEQFFRDILEFVRDIVPVIAELQISIEQTSEKLPTASRQLDNVTAANESASTQILDIVERMIRQIEVIQEWFRAFSRETGGAVPAMNDLVGRIRKNHADDPDSARLSALWEQCTRALGTEQMLAAHVATLEGVKADCTSIMIALQVQDITAQQIAAVNKMMQSVDHGLNALLLHIRGEECGGAGTGYAHHHVDIVFDPAATYDTSTGRQQAADEIVTGLNNGKHSSKR